MQINQMYAQTAPMAAQNIPAFQSNSFPGNNLGNTNGSNQQNQYINPMYWQTAPIAAQNTPNIHQNTQNQYINPMYGQTALMAAQNIKNQPTQYINPMYGQTAPMAAQNVEGSQYGQISLGNTNKKDDDDFGGFQSGQSNNH